MWNIGIPALCVIAHLYLVVLFLPSFWRELDERGFRWHYVSSLFVVPGLTAISIAWYAIEHLDTLPGWLLLVAFLTVDAFVVAMVLAAVGLRTRRRRAA